MSGISLLKTFKDVAHTKTAARDLVSIGRADSLARGAHLLYALGGFLCRVEQAVGRHDEVSLLRDIQARLQFVAAPCQVLRLGHEEVRRQDNTIADYIYFSALEDSRGDAPKHILLSFKLKRVPGIGATLKTGDNIVLRSQHIDNLSFTLVAPLEA